MTEENGSGAVYISVRDDADGCDLKDYRAARAKWRSGSVDFGRSREEDKFSRSSYGSRL
jgi:hypothetical protein